MPQPDLCVTRVPLFQALSHDEQVRVASLARPVTVTRGETLYSPGEELSRLLVVHSGQLKITRSAPNGKEQILRTAAVGDVVGERAFLAGGRAQDRVVALEDSRMCVFRHADLAPLVREHPDIAQAMLRSLSDRLARTERLLAAITSSDAGTRVAAYLASLPRSSSAAKTVVQLPMAKYEVAAHLGTTPETLSRRLAALAAAGVIALRGRREVAILDPVELDSLAEPD